MLGVVAEALLQLHDDSQGDGVGFDYKFLPNGRHLFLMGYALSR